MAFFKLTPRVSSGAPTRCLRSSHARSTRCPTIMAVRDATVGPLFGTRAVSGSATCTSSWPRPRRSQASCVNTVSVPWPISTLAVRISMAPSGRPATWTSGGQPYLTPTGEPRAVVERGQPNASPQVRMLLVEARVTRGPWPESPTSRAPGPARHRGPFRRRSPARWTWTGRPGSGSSGATLQSPSRARQPPGPCGAPGQTGSGEHRSP